MLGLTARDLLDLSDAGASLDWTSRGVLLAGCAWRQASPEDCATLPIGVRDRLLLALRLRTFGGEMLVRYTCAACGAQLEAQLDIGAVLTSHQGKPPPRVSINVDGTIVDVRMPTSVDLLAIADLPPEESADTLFERCLESPAPGERPQLRRRVAEAIAAADPIAALEIELECDACHTRSTEIFDIVSSFWKEIEAGARHAANDVHALASAYGWPEETILSMSSARRARYRALTHQ